MAKALMIWSASNVALVTGEFLSLFGGNSVTSTEAFSQMSATEAATFSLLGARVRAGNSGTATFQFRKNTANGNEVVAFAGVGAGEDATNTDVLAATDVFNVAYTDTGSNSTMAWIKANVEFASGYGNFHGAAAFNGIVCDVASSTRFAPFAGPLLADLGPTEANAQWRVRGYNTFAAMQVRVTANARINDSIFKNRIAGADGTALITFATLVTGLVTDLAVGDAITDGQLLNASLTLDTGVQDLTVAFIVATLTSSTTKSESFIGDYLGLARPASATAHYFPIGGRIIGLTNLTEAQARIKVGFAGVVSNLRCYLSANTYTVDGTLKLYKNGSAVITTTITLSGGAAWYENTSDTATFTATDELSFEVVGGTTGDITIHSIGVTLASVVGSALSATAAATTNLAAAATASVPLSATGAATAILEGATAGAIVSADLSAAGLATGNLATATLDATNLQSTASALGTLAAATLALAHITTSGVAVGTLEGSARALADLTAAGAATATGATISYASSDLSAAGAATGTLSTSTSAYASLSAAGIAIGTLDAISRASADLTAAGASTAILVGSTAGGFETSALSTAGTSTATLSADSRASVALSTAGASTAVLDAATRAQANLSATSLATATADTLTLVSGDLSASGTATGTLAALARAASDLTAAGVSTAIGATVTLSDADLSSAGASTAILEGSVVSGFLSTSLSAAGSSTAILVPASFAAAALQSAGISTATLATPVEADAFLRWGSEARRRRREIDAEDDELLEIIAALAPRLFGPGARL